MCTIIFAIQTLHIDHALCFYISYIYKTIISLNSIAQFVSVMMESILRDVETAVLSSLDESFLFDREKHISVYFLH